MLAPFNKLSLLPTQARPVCSFILPLWLFSVKLFLCWFSHNFHSFPKTPIKNLAKTSSSINLEYPPLVKISLQSSPSSTLLCPFSHFLYVLSHSPRFFASFLFLLLSYHPSLSAPLPSLTTLCFLYFSCLCSRHPQKESISPLIRVK